MPKIYICIDYATGKQWRGDKRRYETKEKAYQAIEYRLKRAYIDHEIINNLVYVRKIKTAISKKSPSKGRK